MPKNLSLDNLNFLIVDDNKHMRALVRSILMTLGAQNIESTSLGAQNIQEAIDGADALKELSMFSADIVICDWNMSPLDGIDFVRMIRTGKDSPNPYLAIIMLTGHTEMGRVVESRDAGVNEFLAKPISAKKIFSRVKSIVERPRKFIRTDSYFGPDRRRKSDPNYIGKERRKTNDDMGQDEVNKLLKG
jgi:two-component system, chemotaxis family, chemotaxis protein CheY